ncbi:SET and MYND domain-containing protein DDB_G0284059-like [Bradysia coprophila]|uniref:SET and MYND domain-containing protein DDB_G0284059-like n=1 Tax=Bradysia coprophila TaxID=38358 RepID=UPI00187D7534|nr:SET and MYND domain-containing protein DDB_G0284059-like [Bradysia coprophila]
MAKPESRNLFDHLYGVFCNNLRELGKASSFCQLIKNANSDLNRITALSKVCNIVLLVKSVKKCMRNNSKNAQRTQDILETYYAKKEHCSDSETDLIALLNSALASTEIDVELNFDRLNDFGRNEVNFIENLLVNSEEKSPTFEELLLSEIHGERSIYFYNATEYEVCMLEALRGIYYAKINRNRPNESLFPLLYLICTALWKLNHSEMASNVLQLSVKLLRISSLDNAAKSVQTVKLVKLMKVVQVSSKDGGCEADQLNFKPFLEHRIETIPKVTETSDVLMGACSSIALKWQVDRGRHVVATQTIPLGTTIITERPFTSTIHPKNNFLFCHNCCHEVKNLVACKDCTTVVFCSTLCRSACQAYHQYECKFMKTFTSSEVLGDKGLLCYRSVCKTDARVLESHSRAYLTFDGSDTAEVHDNELECLSNKFILGLDASGKLDSQNYASIFAQSPNSSARLGGELLKRSFSAIFLTICLRFAGYFEEADVSDIENGKLYEIEQHVASVLLRYLQSASCNSYAVSNINGSNPRRVQINEIGVATYPILSTINHSCNSNIYRFTMGNTSVVKTLREIRTGEEILDSYGPHFASNSIEDRIRFLEEQYLFCCNCQSCDENWLVYSKLPKQNLSIKCPQCDGESAASGKGKNVCLKCSNTFDTRKIMKMTKELEIKFQEAKQRLLNSNKMSTADHEAVQGAIVRYANALEKIQKWPSQTLIECQETLKLCWNLRYQ